MSPKAKSYKKCAVLNCMNCEGKTVHSFPVSSIPREKVWQSNMIKKWQDFCNNPTITLENGKYLISGALCGVGETHFSDDCYPFKGPQKRLKKGSVPTLNPPAPLSSEPVIANPLSSEPVKVDSTDMDLFSASALNMLNKIDFGKDKSIEEQLAKITENAKYLQAEVNRMDASGEWKQFLEKQLTKNLVLAQALHTTGYWEENRKCIVQTLQSCLRKLLLTKSETVTQKLFFNVSEEVPMEIEEFSGVNHFVEATLAQTLPQAENDQMQVINSDESKYFPLRRTVRF